MPAQRRKFKTCFEKSKHISKSGYRREIYLVECEQTRAMQTAQGMIRLWAIINNILVRG